MTRQHFNAERPGLVQQTLVRIFAAIDDGGDLHPGLLQIKGSLIGGIMSGVDTDIVAHGDAVMVQIGAGGRSQHDARPVIVGEDHVALDRTGRQHDLFGADLPKALARLMFGRRREMIGDAFGERDKIVVVITKGGRARQNPHIGQGLQLGKNLLRPFITGQTVDDRAGIETQGSADVRILIHQNDAGASFRGRKRSCETGDTGAGHQHVAMGITSGIMIRIRLARRLAEAGGAADQRFVNLVPGGLRPHERLVVETGREHRRQKIVDGAQIEGQ